MLQYKTYKYTKYTFPAQKSAVRPYKNVFYFPPDKTHQTTLTQSNILFAGYRIVKNKKLFVGTQAPVGQAVSAAKYAPAIAGTADSSRSSYRSGAAAVSATAARPEPPAVVAITPVPPRHSSWRGSPFVYPSDSQSPPLLFPSSTPAAPGRSQYRRPQLYRPSSTAAAPVDHHGYSVRPVDVNSIAATDDDDDDNSSPQPEYRRRFSSSSTPAASVAAEQLNVRPHTFRPAYRKVVDVSGQGSEPAEVAALQYDGVSFVRNGFRYYLPRHYHEERSEGDSRTGSFGYVDPFGIRRVVYYNAAPGSGFVHRKNNRYVGLDAEPYDPRPSQL